MAEPDILIGIALEEKGVLESLKRIGKNLQSAADTGTTGFAKLSKEFDKNLKDIEKSGAAINKLKPAISAFTSSGKKGTKEYNSSLKDLLKTLEEIAKVSRESVEISKGKTVGGAKEALDDTKAGFQADKIGRVVDEIDKLEPAAAGITNTIRQLVAHFDSTVGSAQDLNAELAPLANLSEFFLRNIKASQKAMAATAKEAQAANFEALNQKQVVFEGTGGSIGGLRQTEGGGDVGEIVGPPRQELVDEAAISAAQARIDNFVESLRSATEHTDQSVQNLGTKYEALGGTAANSWRKQVEGGEKAGITIEQLDADLLRLTKDFNDELKRLDASELQIVDESALRTADALYEKLKRLADEGVGSVNEEAKKLGGELKGALGDIEKTFDPANIKPGTKEAQNYTRTLKTISTEFKEIPKAIKKIPKDVLTQRLDLQSVINKTKQLDTVLKKMASSTEKEVKDVGKEFEKMGEDIKDAWDKGEKGTEDTIKALNRVISKANETGRAFDSNFHKLGKAAKGSTPSVWKVGRALDEMGIQGGGSISRVVDAFSSLGPAAIGVALSVGIAVISIKKLAEAAIEVGKAITKAFLGVVKESISTAKSLEVLQRQFTGLFDSQEIATEFIEHLLDLSRELGTDLTGDFAKVFIPRVSSLDQLEKMAKLMATIQTESEKTTENITQALKQAQAGRFKSLISAIGITSEEVDRIQELQESLGATEGLIQGLEEFFERTGRSWEEYGGTLARVQDQFEALQKQILFAIGEPVRRAIVDLAGDFGEFVDENEGLITFISESLGEDIAEVIGRVQTLLGGIFDSFDDQGAEDIVQIFDDLKEDLISAIDKIDEFIDGGNADRLISFLGTAADFAGDLAKALASIAPALETIGKVVRAPEELLADPDPRISRERQIELIKLSQDAIESGGAGKDIVADALTSVGSRFEQILGKENQLESIVRRSVGELLKTSGVRGDLVKAGQEIERILGAIPAAINATADDVDEARLDEALTGNADDLAKSVNAIDDELDKLEEALAKLDLSEAQKRAKIIVDEGRKRIKIELDASRNRQKAYEKANDNIRDSGIKFSIDQENQTIAHANKMADLQIEFDRKNEDAAKDITKKIADIEEKFRQKLEDIRAKFDFDAQEAIRKNDAVALLKIRRRMEFELQQAKTDRDRKADDANDGAEEKRNEILKWLDREEEDAIKSNDRKIAAQIKANREKVAAIFMNYNDELEAIDTAEKQKKDDLKTWNDQQLKDLDTYLGDRLNSMEISFAEELALVQRHAQQMRSALILGRFGLGGIGPLSGSTGGINLFSSPSGSGGSVFAPPSNQSNNLTTQISQQRTEARRLAQQKFAPNTNELQSWMTRINSTSNLSTLAGFISQLKKFALGGFPGVSTGGRKPVMVGERGPEPFLPTSSGIIAPHVPLQMATQSSPVAGGVNNSRTVNADLSLLDPSQVSPIQRTIIKSIVVEEILNNAVA